MTPFNSLPFDVREPAWLWLCVLVPILVPATWRSLSGLEPARRALAIAVRSLLVILIALCLAGIERVRRKDDLTVLFLMDRSHSVEALQNFQEDFIRKAAETIPSTDRLGLIDFARQPFLQQLPMPGGFFIAPGRLPPMQNTDRTDVASAVRLAMAIFPHDTAKRIVLMSDGNDNMGDLLSEAQRAKSDGIPIDVVPLRYQRRNEVYFERMVAPAYAEPGEQAPIRMSIHSHQPAKAKLQVVHNGRMVDLPPEDAQVALEPGSNSYYVKLPVGQAGTQTYEATLTFDDDSMDTVALNNSATAFSFVAGESPVLIVTSDPDNDSVLVNALRGEHVLCEMKTPDQLGDFGLVQMLNYASIVLSNIPAASFSDQQQRELTAYVKEMGSGLIMLGGPESFGAGGWIGSPVEEVMPVSFEIKQKRVIPRGALVLIMHSCEIDRGNYWAKEMAKKSVDTVSSRDYLGVLSYTYSPGGENWEVPLDVAANKAAIKARIDRLQNGDMPDFDRTMQMAYDGLVKGKGADAAQKHVILLSDGDAQPPSPKLLQDYADAKITVSTIGIGWGVHVMERTLVDIARTTGGRYYPAKNPNELPQIFSKESTVIQRPLIIEEPFQPQLLRGASELLGGLRAGELGLPALGGMVLTEAKKDPNVLIPIVRATDDGQDPVLAFWQYELGKTVAFTSGYWPSWGKQWTPWDRFAKFWAQIVRWTLRQESPANFDTRVKIDGNRGTVIIDALDKDGTYLNNLQLQSNLVGPETKPIPGRFVQTAPGHYEMQFDVEKSGHYLAGVRIFDRGRFIGNLRTGLSVSYSPEYGDLTPNEALLRQVADATGGRWLDIAPEKAEVFKHDLPPVESKQPAWEWLLAWVFLPAFLLDVAIRRLASWLALSLCIELVLLVVLLFGLELQYHRGGVAGSIILAELVGWSIRFRYIGPLFQSLTHGVTALARTGERSEASLQQLKGAKDRARSALQQGADAPPADATSREAERRESTPLPKDVAGRRFDVASTDRAAPATDLHDALGGAKTAKPATPQPADPPPGKPGEDESTTSRLLRAKRRTQDRKDEP